MERHGSRAFSNLVRKAYLEKDLQRRAVWPRLDSFWWLCRTATDGHYGGYRGGKQKR